MKKAFSIIGIIMGALIICLGLYIVNVSGVIDTYTGAFTSSHKFGADYYSYQYAATVDAADNVKALGKYISHNAEFGYKVLGLFVAFLGATIICVFGCKLGEAFEKNASNNVKPNADSNNVKPIIVNTETPEQVDEELPEL